MIVILHMRGRAGEPLFDDGTLERIAPEIAGWIVATDVHDARRQAEQLGLHNLATALYSGPEFPRPGRHELSLGWVGESRYVMLVI
jgi:hypothetical protein